MALSKSSKLLIASIIGMLVVGHGIVLKLSINKFESLDISNLDVTEYPTATVRCRIDKKIGEREFHLEIMMDSLGVFERGLTREKCLTFPNPEYSQNHVRIAYSGVWYYSNVVYLQIDEDVHITPEITASSISDSISFLFKALLIIGAPIGLIFLARKFGIR